MLLEIGASGLMPVGTVATLRGRRSGITWSLGMERAAPFGDEGCTSTDGAVMLRRIGHTINQPCSMIQRTVPLEPMETRGEDTPLSAHALVMNSAARA